MPIGFVIVLTLQLYSVFITPSMVRTDQDVATPVSSSIWTPPPDTTWQIQLSGDLDTSFDVEVYIVDLFDTTDAAIAQLHEDGRKVICYFRAGIWEEWRPDSGPWASVTKGKAANFFGGLWWQDIRASQVRKVMVSRLELAREKGCDAVDIDNLDSYLRDTGFPITIDDQLDFNEFLALESHARGLAVGHRNNLALVPELEPYFDFAVVEGCIEESRCELVAPFLKKGKTALSIEYGSTKDVDTICPIANGIGLNTLVKRSAEDVDSVACRSMLPTSWSAAVVRYLSN